MEVGVDTYVSVYQADEYIRNYYAVFDENRTYWENSVINSDKEAYLMSACLAIKQLPFIEFKARMKYADVPDDIKYAQIELALWQSQLSQNAELKQRLELQQQGVTGFSIGDLSETYNITGQAKSLPLSCPKAAALLALYLGGGFTTC